MCRAKRVGTAAALKEPTQRNRDAQERERVRGNNGPRTAPVMVIAREYIYEGRKRGFIYKKERTSKKREMKRYAIFSRERKLVCREYLPIFLPKIWKLSFFVRADGEIGSYTITLSLPRETCRDNSQLDSESLSEDRGSPGRTRVVLCER